MNETVKSPGIKIPPPLIFVASLIAGIGMQRIYSFNILPEGGEYIIGTIIMSPASIIIFFVLRKYIKSKTPFLNVYKQSKVLITSGPNRFTRNPGYLALILLYLGIGFWLDNVWIITLVIPLIMVINKFIIQKEERHLEAVFG
ncbi:MAG: isoprenylcysteine carboxylmethyltransferase family protein, partial [Flavobacteriales bacterium]|nr:isoprenylcysteine carboxylmethyltransferase family protein [Flavobacteriales bacterium]